MPRLDLIHESVKRALIKSGWVVTHDPYTITYGDLSLQADLAAERPIAAEREGQKIVVEVKSFVGPSRIQDLKLALGQYELYRTFLEITAPEREIYLAINDRVYREFFTQGPIRLVVDKNKIAIFTVDIELEEIVTWIK